jgi:hypothetical protein
MRAHHFLKLIAALALIALLNTTGAQSKAWAEVANANLAPAEHVQTGGSSDILRVTGSDATIVAFSGQSLLELRIEPSIHAILWDGVLDGTYQYLSVDDYYFFLDFSPSEQVLYAYDWLGLAYRVLAKSSPRKP